MAQATRLYTVMRILLLSLLLLPSLARADLMSEAFEAAQQAFLSSAGSALRQSTERRASADDALAEALRTLQARSNLLQAAERSLSNARADASASDAQLTRLAGEVDLLRAEIRALDARIARDHPDFVRFARPEPLGLPDVQAALDPGEALIFAFTGARDTYIWAVTPEAVGWHRVALGADTMAHTISEIRASISLTMDLRGGVSLGGEKAPTPKLPEFNRFMASLLYWELIGPLEPILADVTHLYTVLDGPLTGLPLSLLVTDTIADLPGRNDDPASLRDTNWMFQRFAMTTLPSVESLPLIKSDSAPPGDLFLGFGDPDLYGTALETRSAGLMSGAFGDVEAIRGLSPLPGTRRELRQMANILGLGDEALYLRDRATEAELRAAPLDRAGTLVFATHGLLSGELQGLAEPALVLTPPATAEPLNDGLLTASEIASLDLNADWVVLSACNTAGGDGTPDAQGLSGLARAFLFAGARSLLVSHWPVRDDAAARLTTETFAALSDNRAKTKAQALQQAMDALMRDETDPTLAHPAAWAPFALVGDGG